MRPYSGVEPGAASASTTAGRTWTHAVLPYLSLSVVGIVTVGQLAVGHRLTGAQTVAVVALLLTALLRQLVTIAENTTLLARVRDSERRLHHLAFHDPLTGLANRALFTDRLELAVARHARDGRPLAVVYCDLDDFKAVNDTFGHEAGDEMLRATADRLLNAVRGSDTVARIGGDEFAVVLDGHEDPADLARRLATELDRPCRLGGVWRPVKASIGVAVADPDAQPRASALLRTADVAMYEAKEDGKGRVAVRHAPTGA